MVSLSVVSPVCLFVAAVSCLLLYAGARATAPVSTRWLAMGGLFTVTALALFFTANPGNLIVSNILVLCVGLLGGVLIGRHIVSAKVLAVAVACAAMADCASFLFGPTHFALRQAAGTGAEPLIAYLAVTVPIHAQLYSVIGLGDLWIFTACVSAALRLGWPKRLALVVPLSGIILAVVAGLIFGPLPALPFLAVAVLIYLGLFTRRQPKSPSSACRV